MELTRLIKGTLTIRGKIYRVDCFETLDRGSGHRPEVGLHTLGWMHAYFGDDLALHWINRFDLEKKAGHAQSLAHGYVLENGRLTGLSDLKWCVTRQGTLPMVIEAEATDASGRAFAPHVAAQLAALGHPIPASFSVLR